MQVGGFLPYPISYRSLIPKATDCTNLLVPVCLSATHIAYGSIRMEPVFMVLGQSSAVAAVQAIDTKTTVQTVDVSRVQRMLRENPLVDGSQPDILIDDQDTAGRTITGDWITSRTTRGAYGPSVLRDDSKGAAPKAVRFKPTIARSGRYRVYAYFPRIEEAASQIPITIAAGPQTQSLTLQADDVRVEGQTSGSWAPLGEHTFPAGNGSYVEISNRGADGVIVVDAVLLVPVR